MKPLQTGDHVFELDRRSAFIQSGGRRRRYSIARQRSRLERRFVQADPTGETLCRQTEGVSCQEVAVPAAVNALMSGVCERSAVPRKMDHRNFAGYNQQSFVGPMRSSCALGLFSVVVSRRLLRRLCECRIATSPPQTEPSAAISGRSQSAGGVSSLAPPIGSNALRKSSAASVNLERSAWRRIRTDPAPPPNG